MTLYAIGNAPFFNNLWQLRFLPLQDRLDTEVRKKQELESKLKTKGHELEESQKRLDKLEEHIRVSKIQLDEQEKMASDLQGNVGCSKERISDLQRDLVSQKSIKYIFH